MWSQGPVSELRSAYSSNTSRVFPASLCSGSAAVCCSAVRVAVSSFPIAEQSTYAAETDRDLALLSHPLSLQACAKQSYYNSGTRKRGHVCHAG